MKQLLLLTLALFSLSLQAADIRYYDVEVIIFEHLQANSRNAEQWPQKIEREIPKALIEIGGDWPGGIPEEYDPALSFIPLPESKWRLKAETEKIDESTSRRLLAHVAWVQPGLSQEQAISVHFNRPVTSNDETVESEIVTSDQTVGDETVDAQTNDKNTQDSGTLDALIRISLARYLRVETDLLFTLDEPLPEENVMYPDSDSETETETIPAAPHYFHVQQLRRRIRSTELHYLDHPVLGMLIMFTPHETSNKAAAKKK